jgi:hypothetical protein
VSQLVMIDFENGFGKWIASVPDAAVVCCEAANMASYLLLDLLFSVGESCRSLGGHYCCVDGGGVFFRNVGNHVPDHTVSHCKCTVL